MGRWLLAAGFVVAALPFGGFVAAGVRYTTRRHASGNPPSVYGWVFASASLVVCALFLLAALRVVGHGPSWRALWIAALVAFPLVGVASLGSLQVLGGMAVLLLAIRLLRSRTSRDTA